MKKNRFDSASFRLKAGLRTYRFWLWLIRFIGVIVPQRFRARFRRGWEAGVEYRGELLARWGRLAWRKKTPLVVRGMGGVLGGVGVLRPRWGGRSVVEPPC